MNGPWLFAVGPRFVHPGIVVDHGNGCNSLSEYTSLPSYAPQYSYNPWLGLDVDIFGSHYIHRRVSEVRSPTNSHCAYQANNGGSERERSDHVHCVYPIATYNQSRAAPHKFDHNHPLDSSTTQSYPTSPTATARAKPIPTHPSSQCLTPIPTPSAATASCRALLRVSPEIL